MTRAESRARRRAALLMVPVLVGVLAAAGTATLPRSSVHGSALTGPEGLSSVKPATVDFRPRLAWGPGRRAVILSVDLRGACRLRLTGVSSTAPGRIEAHVLETGRPCRGALERPRALDLPLPTLPDPAGGVRVQIGRFSTYLHRSTRPESHPKGALDVD